MTDHDLRLIEIGEKAGAEKATKQIVAWLRTAEVQRLGAEFESANALARAIEAGEHLK